MIPTIRCSSLPSSSSSILPPSPVLGNWGGRFIHLLFVGMLCGNVSRAEVDEHFCPGEQDRARSALQRIQREWPLRGSGDAVTRFVQSFGDRIALFSDRGRMITWRFALVRNLAPNAFSIGAGFVFVTDGSVGFARNESELAAILAHEMGHELAGHFCGTAPSSDSSGWFDIFSDRKNERNEIGFESLKQEIDVAEEQQADQIAVSILQSAGYNPHAMLEVARRLPTGGLVHQASAPRIQALTRLLTGLPTVAVHDSAKFQAIKGILAAEGVGQ